MVKVRLAINIDKGCSVMYVNISSNGKAFSSWEDVFKAAQEMPFIALNTGTITSVLKTYVYTKSLPSTFNTNEITKHPVMVFGFRHLQKGDVLIDSGFDRSFR
jgi:hypothetical protein